MGHHASACICFGVPLDDFDFYDEKSDQDFESIGQWLAWRDGLDWEDWRVAERADNDAPVEVGYTYEYSENAYLFIRNASYTAADDWTPTAFDPDSLRVTDEQIAEARAFCARYDLPFENPKWLLVPSYG